MNRNNNIIKLKLHNPRLTHAAFSHPCASDTAVQVSKGVLMSDDICPLTSPPLPSDSSVCICAALFAPGRAAIALLYILYSLLQSARLVNTRSGRPWAIRRRPSTRKMPCLVNLQHSIPSRRRPTTQRTVIGSRGQEPMHAAGNQGGGDLIMACS